MAPFAIIRPAGQGSPRRLAIAFLADTRRALGLSRSEFAERLATLLEDPVSEAQVRGWEDGQLVLPAEVLMAAMLLPAQEQQLHLDEWLEAHSS